MLLERINNIDIDHSFITNMKIKRIAAGLLGGVLSTIALSVGLAPKAEALSNNTPYFTGAFACSYFNSKYEAYIQVGPTFPLGVAAALRWRASWIGPAGLDVTKEIFVTPPVTLPGFSFADVVTTDIANPDAAFLEYARVTGIGVTTNPIGIPVFYPVTDSPLYLPDYVSFADGTTSDDVDSACPEIEPEWPATPKANPKGYNTSER